jgi:hypothetical protein
MKFIHKIDWNKVSNDLITVTNTNKGTKYYPIFDAHLLKPKTREIEYLGEFGKDRILKECNEKNIRIGELMGWSKDYQNNIDDNNANIDGFISQSYRLCAKWIIGRIMGVDSFKISKFI